MRRYGNRDAVPRRWQPIAKFQSVFPPSGAKIGVAPPLELGFLTLNGNFACIARRAGIVCTSAREEKIGLIAGVTRSEGGSALTVTAPA